MIIAFNDALYTVPIQYFPSFEAEFLCPAINNISERIMSCYYISGCAEPEFYAWLWITTSIVQESNDHFLTSGQQTSELRRTMAMMSLRMVQMIFMWYINLVLEYQRGRRTGGWLGGCKTAQGNGWRCCGWTLKSLKGETGGSWTWPRRNEELSSEMWKGS